MYKPPAITAYSLLPEIQPLTLYANAVKYAPIVNITYRTNHQKAGSAIQKNIIDNKPPNNITASKIPTIQDANNNDSLLTIQIPPCTNLV